MDSNKVNVNIYGQEYTIVGDNSPEYIARVAAHVDSRMNDIAKGVKGGPLSSLAILSAVNITDEFFRLQDREAVLRREYEQLKADSSHYEQLWEEAKKSHLSYKEESQAEISKLSRQKDELMEQMVGKNQEIDRLTRERQKVMQEAKKGSAQAVEEVNAKYRDLENNYFDLQMENIQLKSEMEKLKAELREQRDE
ncbi:MAG: cell division protein ZapA [Eubacteriales bacterium]|nr:cell division protein ZapA [Eubacteriales bacterium]